jgi:hypothetical protein
MYLDSGEHLGKNVAAPPCPRTLPVALDPLDGRRFVERVDDHPIVAENLEAALLLLSGDIEHVAARFPGRLLERLLQIRGQGVDLPGVRGDEADTVEMLGPGKVLRDFVHLEDAIVGVVLPASSTPVWIDITAERHRGGAGAEQLEGPHVCRSLITRTFSP